jgi:hypothetical protein
MARKLSGKSPNGSKKPRAKHTPLGENIIRGMQELQAHMRGEIKLRTRRFKSEAEEADWHASPEGQRATEREFRKAIREGKVIVNSSSRLGN